MSCWFWGAGTGGAIVANMLARRLGSDWKLTVIGRAKPSPEQAAELMDKRQIHERVVTDAAGGVDRFASRSDLVRLLTLRT